MSIFFPSNQGSAFEQRSFLLYLGRNMESSRYYTYQDAAKDPVGFDQAVKRNLETIRMYANFLNLYPNWKRSLCYFQRHPSDCSFAHRVDLVYALGLAKNGKSHLIDRKGNSSFRYAICRNRHKPLHDRDKCRFVHEGQLQQKIHLNGQFIWGIYSETTPLHQQPSGFPIPDPLPSVLSNIDFGATVPNQQPFLVPNTFSVFHQQGSSAAFTQIPLPPVMLRGISAVRQPPAYGTNISISHDIETRQDETKSELVSSSISSAKQQEKTFETTVLLGASIPPTSPAIKNPYNLRVEIPD